MSDVYEERRETNIVFQMSVWIILFVRMYGVGWDPCHVVCMDLSPPNVRNGEENEARN